MNVQGMSYLFPGYESTTRYYYTVYACAELQFMRVAENAIRTTEMRERRMIVSRTGLIRIWYRPWLFNYAWTVYGYDGEQLIDAAYHSTNVAKFSSCTIMMRALHMAGGGGAVVRCIW